MPSTADAHITAEPAGGGERAHTLRIASDAYCCPGESHPISRSVHLARLAAYYPACRACEHRHDTGNLPRQIVERIDRVARREVRSSLISPEGIRGVYLNELGRPQAEQYAAAFASLLRERRPLHGRSDDDDLTLPSQPPRPTIVLGRDARPASPEIAVGVAAALRRMGCHVIDVGLVSLPCFWFAVEHLESDGGVCVTGHGFGAAMTGLDFLERHAVPWSQGLSLDRVEDVARGAIPRPTRRGGSQTTFRATAPYLDALRHHFHALRPLQIGVACLASAVTPVLQELFAELPCRLHWISSPDAQDAPLASAPVSLSRLAATIKDSHLHAGVLIGDDGQSIRVLNERGRVIPLTRLISVLARQCDRRAPSGQLIVDESLPPAEVAALSRAGWNVVTAAGTRESNCRALQQSDALLAADAAGRCWFRDQAPACDAILTVARLLQCLSTSDAPASALAKLS